MVPMLSCGKPTARVVNRRAVAGFTFKEWFYAPGLKVPRNAHVQANVVRCLHGPIQKFMEDNADSETVWTGIPSGERGALAPLQCMGGRCFVVEVGSRWIERLREDCRILHETADLQKGCLHAWRCGLYREFSQADSACLLAMEVGGSRRWLRHFVGQISERRVAALAQSGHGHATGTVF